MFEESEKKASLVSFLGSREKLERAASMVIDGNGFCDIILSIA